MDVGGSDQGAELQSGQALRWCGAPLPADARHRAVQHGDLGTVIEVMGLDEDGALQVVVTFNEDNTFVALASDIAPR